MQLPDVSTRDLFDPATDATGIVDKSGSIVLVIDDEPAVVDATQLLLELEGYRVLVALTANDAVQTVSVARVIPAIIIADFHLSGAVTGVDAIRAVREATGHDIPAVLVTGDTSSLIADVVHRVGACELLNKPVHTDALLKLMAQLISLRNGNEMT